MSIYVKGRHNKKESLIEMVLLEKKIRFDENSIFRTRKKVIDILLNKNRDYER